MKQKIKKSLLHEARKAIADAGLYLIPKTEIDDAARTAADAFLDYPLHTWFDGGKYNEELTNELYKINIRALYDFCVIYADSREINGLAIWLPPEFQGINVISFLRCGGFRFFLKYGFGLIPRLLIFDSYASKIKKQLTENQDWYLFNLTVKQSAQGNGLSRTLLQPMLDFSDKTNTFCYLETYKKKNVSIYEHFSFQLKTMGYVPKSDLIHYAMMRMPQKNM